MNICVILPFHISTEASKSALLKAIKKIRRNDVFILGFDNDSKLNTRDLDVVFDGIINLDHFADDNEIIWRGVEFAEEEEFDFVAWDGDWSQLDGYETSYCELPNGACYFGVQLTGC